MRTHTHSVSDKRLRRRLTGSLDCCAPRSAGVCVCAGEVVVTAGRVHGWTTLDGGILTRGVPGTSTHLKPNPAVAPRRLHPDQMTGSHIDKNTRPVSNPPPPPLSHSSPAQKSRSYCLMLDSCLLFNSFTGFCNVLNFRHLFLLIQGTQFLHFCTINQSWFIAL